MYWKVALSNFKGKGFKYDIQQFYTTWHEPSGGNEEITAGLISVKELVNEVSIKDNWQKIWSDSFLQKSDYSYITWNCVY